MQIVFYVVAGLLILHGFTGMLGFVLWIAGLAAPIPHQQTIGQSVVNALGSTLIPLGLGVYLWFLAVRCGAQQDQAVRQRSLWLGSIILLALGLLLIGFAVRSLLSFCSGYGSQMDVFALVLVPPGAALFAAGVVGLMKAGR